MALEVNGQTVETTENGYLVDLSDWSEAVAEAMAKEDGVELTEKHWDVIKYLRDEHINNAGNEPMERVLMKEMGKIWGKKPTSKELYVLFPGAPTKQGRKYAGLPQSTRKGGY
jgi:tRNA 2-thiouridine synthesizing protein E